MDHTAKNIFNYLTTYELAFKLASGTFSEGEKLEVLKIILDRDLKLQGTYDISPTRTDEPRMDEEATIKHFIKKPLKGSKTEKIYNLAMAGKSPQECYDVLTNEGIKVYYAEIYRVYKRYSDD